MVEGLNNKAKLDSEVGGQKELRSPFVVLSLVFGVRSSWLNNKAHAFAFGGEAANTSAKRKHEITEMRGGRVWATRWRGLAPAAAMEGTRESDEE